MIKQSNNNNDPVGIGRDRESPHKAIIHLSLDHDQDRDVGRNSMQSKKASAKTKVTSSSSPSSSSWSNTLSPSAAKSITDREEQLLHINRRSRSNSIAAGAIARLKNLPQIKLSLPPEDLYADAATAGTAADAHHSASPDCSQQHASRFLMATPAASFSACKLTRDKDKMKVLDQKDLNLKPETDQSLRRNSLPLSDKLLGTSGIQIRFLTGTTAAAAGRRLSQVSSVVSAQIQSTIGWKTVISEDEVVDQAKCLAAKFVWFKLRKNGFCQKRFHLQRLRSVCSFGDNEDMDRILNQVVQELRSLSHELEVAHPKIFTSVLNQVGPMCFKSVSTVTKTQILVGQFLFSCQDITWTHVAAFFTITSALALDSVMSGHHDFVMPLIDNFADFAAGDLAQWVAQEGGWDSIVNKYREEDEWMKKFRWILVAFAILFMTIAIFFIF